jgi:hypothetical protein
MRKSIFFTVLLTLLLLISVAGPASAGTQALPALPPSSLIDRIISETGGPTFTPIGAPDILYDGLVPLNGPLDFIESYLDDAQAVSYISTANYLYETVVPILGANLMQLTPDITAPGTPSVPGKIIGATYQRGRGVMAIVATFPNWDSTNPTGLRFYYSSTQYYWTLPVIGQFYDPDQDLTVEASEEGAVISDKWSCIVVGLKQVCWAPYSTSQLRDSDAVRNLLLAANTQAQNRYNLTVSFGVNDAVPDLIGTNRRILCRNEFGYMEEFITAKNPCQPNLAFVHATSTAVGQPIGLWVVRYPAQLKAYDMRGVYRGWLAANSYLVMDATPNRNIPGQVGVLMLVDIYGSQHYLIPSNVMQGFGQSIIINEWEAAIKDGTLRFRGF